MADVAGLDSARGAVGALLFLQAATNVFDVYSALNSSPWTSENFGADPEKAASCREYVWHAVGWTTFYCGLAAIIAKSWWPIFGLVLANVYLVWLYERALGRGAVSGSDGWASA